MKFDIKQMFARALDLLKAGRFAEAEPLYRQILVVDPNHVDGLHLLGVVAYHLGRNDEALNLIGKAIGLNDRVADFHCNMGSVLSALGRANEAVAHYTRAIALEPRHARSFNNLGNLLRDEGKPLEAETQLRRAIALNPNYVEAHYNLAIALAAQGKLDEAAAHYWHALTLAPNFVNARNNLGIVLQRQGKLDEAAAQFRQMIERDPGDARAHYNLGNLLRAKADYAAAIEHYKQSLATRPESADAWNNMGAALAERGDLEEAREAYQKAVEADPTRAAYHRNLANYKRFEPGDLQLSVMEQLAENPASMPEHERVDLQFALGKAYADLKQHERSFRHLLAGNALKRAQAGYDEAEAIGYMQRVRKIFDAELLRAKAGCGEAAPTPVFIVGMPRSGTTLIEQIIASHPKAFGAGELFDLDNIVQSLAGLNGGALRFPEVVAIMSGEQLREVGARYVAAIRALAPTVERVADKMPWNFHFPGLIHLALPNARIIHARRDPVDTCLSCFSILFDGDGNRYTYDLGELGRFYRSYESLMAHWRAVLPPGVMIEVQYEEVVAGVEEQARRIIAHCGLDWHDACLAFHETRRPVRTSSVAQVRQPIYQSSVGRWRPYREHLRPLLDELGIDPENGMAPPATRSDAVVENIRATDCKEPTRRDVEEGLRSGQAVPQSGWLDEAEGAYQQILARDPSGAEAVQAHINLARVLRERGKSDAAISHYEKAIALKPDDADIHSNLGRLLGELGRIAQARAAYEKAIALLPRCGAVYLNLAYCDKVAPDDPYLAAMEKLAQDQDALGERDRIDLDFALGKAYADIGQYERSFRHLLQGNARKRKTLVYDEAATLGELERIRWVLDAKLIRASKRRGNPSHLPVFIVGMPRSGTSLIEQILASHPKVFGAGELTAFQDAVAGLAQPGGGSLPFPELLLSLPKQRLRELGSRYLTAVKAIAPASSRVTDKMPGNFCFVGLIHLALPNARIIHAQRDPVDTCLSCFAIQFTAGGSEYSYELGELGRCYRAYQALMTHWRNVLPSGVMLDVQYEDVVNDLEGQARRIVAHCGLDWDERCLAFPSTQRAVRTASAAQVRRSIYRSSIGRWRPDQALLQPLLEALHQPREDRVSVAELESWTRRLVPPSSAL